MIGDNVSVFFPANNSYLVVWSDDNGVVHQCRGLFFRPQKGQTVKSQRGALDLELTQPVLQLSMHDAVRLSEQQILEVAGAKYRVDHIPPIRSGGMARITLIESSEKIENHPDGWR